MATHPFQLPQQRQTRKDYFLGFEFNLLGDKRTTYNNGSHAGLIEALYLRGLGDIDYIFGDHIIFCTALDACGRYTAISSVCGAIVSARDLRHIYL